PRRADSPRSRRAHRAIPGRAARARLPACGPTSGMTATWPIEPVTGPVHATVRVPGSKSITNRALVCAALASGTSVLDGALRADDVDAMIDCLSALGIPVSVAGEQVRVTGCAGKPPAWEATLDARLSGTTARFIGPVAAIGHGRFVLDGAPPLRRRPMAPLVSALRSLGVDLEETAEPGHLPVVIHASGVRGGRVALAGDISSQFVSGLLMAAPCFDLGVEIALTTELVSEPYVAMTRAVMAAFGVASDGLTVPPGQYHGTAYAIEPDASAASYFFAAAVVCGGEVRVEGLGRESLQGDLAFVDVLARMGADVHQDATATTVRGTGTLHGVTVDLRHLSDMVPTLAAVAAFADSPTRITGVGFIRGKESDRIAATVAELRRCGVAAHAEPDGLTV